MDDLILNKDNVAGDSLPVRQRFGGKQNGLTIKINPEVHEYSTCTSNDGWGFKVISTIFSPLHNNFPKQCHCKLLHYRWSPTVPSAFPE